MTIWTDGRIVAFGDAAGSFEEAAFGAFIVVDGHGIRNQERTRRIESIAFASITSGKDFANTNLDCRFAVRRAG
jgi:glutamate synthase domain-containing protein 3